VRTLHLGLVYIAITWCAQVRDRQLTQGQPAFTQSGTGAAIRTIQSKLADIVSVVDFGADPTGKINATPAFTAAVASNNVSILIPPGIYTLATKWTILYNNVTVHASGATVVCKVPADDCIVFGDLHTYANPVTRSKHITISGLTIVPGVQSAGAAIHVDSEFTTLELLKFSSNPPNYFANGIQVDYDEDFVLRNSPISAGVLRCDAMFCGSLLYNPPESRAAIAYVSDSYLAPNCDGNSLDWGSGNDLRLSSVVIEGYSQFGLRYQTPKFPADARVVINKVHNEAGGCTNPSGNVGKAGYIMVGGILESDLAQLGGTEPQFVVTGAGATRYNYYVQPKGPVGWGGELPIGYVSNGPATINGTHFITLAWPTVPQTTSYNIYRVPVATTGRIVPTTTGNWLVANVPQNGTGTQAFTDNVTIPGSVAPPQPAWAPSLPYWPGSVILSASDPTNAYTNAAYWGPGSSGVFVVASWYLAFPAVNLLSGASDYSGDTMPTSAYTRAGFWNTQANSANLAFLLPLDYFGAKAYAKPLKGIINTYSTSVGPTDIVTFNDSSIGATLGTPSNRPLADASDSAICTDATSALCLRAPSSISSYINALPDGAKWTTRLTAAALTSTVPLRFASGSGYAQVSAGSRYVNGELHLQAAGSDNATVFDPDGGVVIGRQSGRPPVDGLVVSGTTKLGEVLQLGTSTFAKLPTPTAPANGILYCSDCDAPSSVGAACTSRGAKDGAEAHYVRGRWICF
jgi:hypothetical protein